MSDSVALQGVKKLTKVYFCYAILFLFVTNKQNTRTATVVLEKRRGGIIPLFFLPPLRRPRLARQECDC